MQPLQGGCTLCSIGALVGSCMRGHDKSSGDMCESVAHDSAQDFENRERTPVLEKETGKNIR